MRPTSMLRNTVSNISSAIVLLISASVVNAQSCDGQWLASEGYPGVSGQVRAVIAWDPDGDDPQTSYIVVAGDFQAAGNVAASNIALWNGSGWADVGGGIDGLVTGLAVLEGQLIAAGYFSHAGGTPVNRVARWDGESWSDFGNGMTNIPYAMFVHDGELFTGIGGLGASNIGWVMRWTGEEWAQIGGSMNKAVLELGSYQGQIVAAGEFTLAGGNAANGIARWDGNDWQPLGIGITNATIYDMVSYGGESDLGDVIDDAVAMQQMQMEQVWGGWGRAVIVIHLVTAERAGGRCSGAVQA